MVTATLAAVTTALDDVVSRGSDVDVTDATHDSRQVVPGSLFCAVRGARSDGHDHAAQAVDRGAAALLVDHWLDLPVPQVRVPDVRAAAGPAAAAVHDHPSRELTVVGITGTNGKTTTAYLLDAAFRAAGTATGLIGTVETRIRDTAQPGVRTTPEGPDLQRLLRRMRADAVDAVSMEVSSHGLHLHRVDGTRFEVVAYTNLSRDHLDLHGTMEAYFAAKARLFTPGFAPRGVVFLDGPWARRLLDSTEIPVVTVGRDPDADVVIGDDELSVTGGRARLRSAAHGWDLDLRTRLPGRFNLDNAAVAAVLALLAGVDPAAALDGIATNDGAPGRLDRVDAGQPFSVFVDYAHTPDAVAATLAAMRALLPRTQRLVVVLGCGGDRDRDKRGPMGAAAARGADTAVLTSDNPRSEDPQRILDAVAAGAREAVAEGASATVVVELDRRAAIARALAAADAGDVVVIAGKGHEAVQEFADRTVAFDDREVARSLLAASAGGP